MDTLGLFPLGIVLFPESVLPLHIFEDRYKVLIKECIDSGKIFGINLIESSKLHNIGCSAEVAELFQVFDDGKMDILVRGLKRFKVKHFTESTYGYFIGKVEYFQDADDEIEEYVLMDCIEKYNIIVDNLVDLKIEKLDILNIKTKMPSFLIAQKAGLALLQKQTLLEIHSENKRLLFLQDHLTKILPMVREAEHVSKIVRNDGYYNPFNFRG
ncbi:MAG: peptidase lon domain protein [Ignavibacteria bacterium]|nr:peptidase lon domain protein [Ignavibacteria bacterium]